MRFVVLLLAILIETLVFAQMPILTVVPALTAGVLIFISIRLTPGLILLYSLTVGLVYDLLRHSSSSLLYFYYFGLLGLAIMVLRGQVVSQSKRSNNLHYLSLVAFASLSIVLIPAFGLSSQVGHLKIVYTIIIQFIFLSSFFLVLRKVDSSHG